MSNPALGTVVGRLRRRLARGELSAHSDGKLLGQFVGNRDEAAFAELVARLGPAVFAACRRLIGDHHAAEDAFQAVFLVLARKAHTIHPREAVGGWVYGVARRVALEAFAMRRRRGEQESPVAVVPERPAPDQDRPGSDVLAALVAELAALSEPYRSAVVLCELRGVGRRDAATQLGIPEGTLSSRLAAARRVLAARLRARGITLSAAGIGVALAEAGQSQVPAELSAVTIRLAASAIAPEPVFALTQEVLRAMFAIKLKRLTFGLIVAAGMAFALTGLNPQRSDGLATAAPAPADKPGEIFLLKDTDKGRVLVALDPDGRVRRQTRIKEGALAPIVSPAHNLVWFFGKDGKAPDPVPDDRTGLTLHFRPLDDDRAEATDTGLKLEPWVRALNDGRTGIDQRSWAPAPGLQPKAYEVTLVDGIDREKRTVRMPPGLYVPWDLSPDGSWLLAEEIDTPKGIYRLHKVPTDGGQPVLLTGAMTCVEGGRISPSGKQVLVHGCAPVPGSDQAWHVGTYVIDVATQKATCISGEQKQWLSRGVWSPTGRRIAYVWCEAFDPASKRRLVVSDADGRNAKVVLETTDVVSLMEWR